MGLLDFWHCRECLWEAQDQRYLGMAQKNETFSRYREPGCTDPSPGCSLDHLLPPLPNGAGRALAVVMGFFWFG